MRTAIGTAAFVFNQEGNIMGMDFLPRLPISVDGPLYHNLEEKLDGHSSEDEILTISKDVVTKWFREISKEELHQSIPVEVTAEIKAELWGTNKVKHALIHYYYNSVNPQLN